MQLNENATLLAQWQRLEFGGTPIYVRPDLPDWFVPNQAADQALILWRETRQVPPEIRDLPGRITGPAGTAYHSRAEHLGLDEIRECWLT